MNVWMYDYTNVWVCECECNSTLCLTEYWMGMLAGHHSPLNAQFTAQRDRDNISVLWASNTVLVYLLDNLITIIHKTRNMV